MGEACRQQYLASIPVAADTLGGWHKVAAQHIKKLGAVLARHKGEDEQVEVASPHAGECQPPSQPRPRG